MEGHPGYEDRRAAPVRRVDSSDVIRKQAFLLLEGERRSLAAHLRPAWRPRGRYEDLSLVIMLARLERDWLSQSGPRPVGGDPLGVQRNQPRSRLAGWAMPWGAAPRTKLEADIDHMGDALKRLGRWLPRRTVAKAERGARRRLANIATGLQEPGPRAWPAVPAPPQGPAPDRPRFPAPSRRRVAAVAALLFLGAAPAPFCLPAPSGAAARTPFAARAVGRGWARISTRPTSRFMEDRGRGAEIRTGRATGRSGATPRAGSQGSARSTSVASEPAPAPPEPAPVAEPVAAPQPTPAPVPASAPSSSTSSQAKGAGGCPPEFGYEC